MENKIYCLVKRLKADRVRRQRFAAVMIVLSMIVSSTVFWQLHSTGNALTDEFLCGMSEHKHSTGCLSLSCGNESEDHVHTAQCYAFSCGKSSHLHTAQCRSDISADIETEDVWEATLPEEMTGDKCENIAAVAESQLGYTESTKNFILADDGVTRKGYTRYGKWYGNPYGDWNTLFAYFCLYYAGVTEKELPYGSGCWAWTEALKKAELFNSPKDVTVKVGDLVFFDTDSDEKPDRVGIVSEIKEDEEAGITITAIEGDLDGKVDKAEYSLEDEKLAGFVSMDMLAEADLEFPELSLGDSEMAAYASNGNTNIVVNGETNTYTTAGNRLEVNEGDTITVEITLHRYNGQGTNNNPTAYFEEVDQTVYDTYTPDFQKFEANDYVGTTHYHTTPANIWTSNGLNNVNPKFNATDENTVTLRKVFTAGTPGEYTITYNNCNAANAGYEDLYVRVNNSSTPDPQPTGTKIHMIKPTQEKTNKHLTAETAFSMQPEESVTLVGTVGRDKYTLYDNAEAYNKAKAENKDNELRFVQIGNKYISTYARFWGLDDRNDNQYTSDRFKEDSVKYALDGDNLTVTATYTANDIGITTNNKYIVTFADGKTWESFEKFYLANDAPLVYVYSTVGWKDIDRVHEAMDGKGGNSGNGSYWQNGPDADASLGSGSYYIVHPGDEIYLAGEGSNGTFGNPRPVTNNTDAKEIEGTSPTIDKTNALPPDDTSNKNGIKLTMPSNVNDNADVLYQYLYAVDYTCTTDSGETKTKTFYFMLSNRTLNSYVDATSGETKWYSIKFYDHADIEIADGGVYEMVSEHSVKPDGTEIETVRVYKSYITSIDHCDVNLTNSTLTIPGGEYSAQNNPGETQYELTSKYLTNGNGKRVRRDENGELIEDENARVTGVREFMQTEVKSADFDVNVLLIPDSEITTIKYPNGVTEQIVNADFKNTESVDVKGVTLHMDRQSVIDAVNKCPNHSGLDFTIRDEAVTKQLRSGNALIEAYKLFKDEQGNVYSDNLVGGEFEFELYKCDDNTYNTTGKTPVSTVTNNANGYVYFDQQFYIYPGTGEPSHTDYYVIKEKIPNSPDADITYSTREVKVTITYEPDDTSGSPTYKTTVKYDDVEGAIPEFVNIKKAYTLPSTGGSGTTIFYICGPALMLTAAALFVIRRRKEENQH